MCKYDKKIQKEVSLMADDQFPGAMYDMVVKV